MAAALCQLNPRTVAHSAGHNGWVSEPIPLFPVTRVDPVQFAAAQHRLFTGMRLHIGRSDIAHQVAWVPWINSVTLPAPACHRGWSGLGAGGEITPTHQRVSCRKCLRPAEAGVSNPVYPAGRDRGRDRPADRHARELHPGDQVRVIATIFLGILLNLDGVAGMFGTWFAH
jgi:hypothetical protein